MELASNPSGFVFRGTFVELVMTFEVGITKGSKSALDAFLASKRL